MSSLYAMSAPIRLAVKRDTAKNSPPGFDSHPDQGIPILESSGHLPRQYPIGKVAFASLLAVVTDRPHWPMVRRMADQLIRAGDPASSQFGATSALQVWQLDQSL
jgi:hypothetical protein